MKLLILPDDKFMLQSGTAPTIGREYILEDALEGTGARVLGIGDALIQRQNL